MENHIVKKITFNESCWFDHLGNNPNAIEKREMVEPRVKYSYDEKHRQIKNPKKLRVWKKLTIFKKNESIEFRPGLNIIVGENGSGKSTLLKFLTDAAFGELQPDEITLVANGALRSLDFETGNPRYSINPNPGSDRYTKDIISMWCVNRESHGETLTTVFDSILDCDETCIILDEPETALSLKNQYKYLELLKEKSKTNQIIAVTHCKTFIENADNVFDMVTRKWTTGKKYVKKIQKQFKLTK